MDPRKFWTICRLHDWFYPYSDDPGAYREGKEEQERLFGIAQTDPALMTVFRQWESHMWDAGPRPDEPKMEE